MVKNCGLVVVCSPPLFAAAGKQTTAAAKGVARSIPRKKN
jgi:hypothetical protein